MKDIHNIFLFRNQVRRSGEKKTRKMRVLIDKFIFNK